jgi:hypothetical protein
MQSLECSNQRNLSSLSPSNASTLEGSKRGDGPWDSILRGVCRGGMFWEDVIPPKNRPVPLHITSSLSQGAEQSPETSSLKRRLLRVLSLSAQANLTASMIADHDVSGSTLLPSTVISQWTLLQTFLLDAIQDVQPLFNSQLFLSPAVAKDEDLFSTVLRQSLQQEEPQFPGLLNLLLHLMHATGQPLSPSSTIF